MSYSYHYTNNHIIADLNGRQCLIDTGSPISLGDGEVKIDRKTHQLPGRDYVSYSLDEISQHVGENLDALIGGDILSQHPGLFIWWQKNELHFLNMNGTGGNPLDLWNNIPIIEIKLKNQLLRAYVDTGAKVSYIDKDLVADLPRCGEMQDFYPGYGEMTVSLVMVDNFQFAILPNDLERLLEMADCHAILGVDWLSKDKAHMQINYKDKTFQN